MLRKHLLLGKSLLVGGLLLFTMLVSGQAFAARTIQGEVKDADGNPVEFASILIVGTTKGGMTDENGAFSLSVDDKARYLSFSYIGYTTKEVEIPATGAMNVVMESDANTLEDVVVVGYGTMRKRDLTGSVASVSAKQLANIPVSSAAEAITGKLAGVQITTSEGSPDADVKIRVRGGGSITRDNSPLYIVDGFPVDNISDIPPSDIQSIDVLKDASSTAIYGARGANGVIIITTKNPKEGKISVSYNGYVGVKKIAKELDVLNPYQFANLQYEQAVLQNKVGTQYEPYFGIYQDMDMYNDVTANNWQDQVFGRIGTTSNQSLSVNGGTKQVSFNMSYNRVDDKAIMMGSDYTRDNLILKMNAKPLEWFKINFTARYSNTLINGAGANDQTGTEKSTQDSRLKHSVIYTPIPLKNQTSPDDDEESIGSLYPPTVAVNDNSRQRTKKNYSYNGGFSIDFTKQLVWRSELGLDNNVDNDQRFYGLSTYYVRDGATYKNQPAIQMTDKTKTSFRVTNTLSYDFKKVLPEKHSLSVMVGQELFNINNQSKETWVENFPTNFDANMAWGFTSQGTPISYNNYYTPEDKLVSFFGRANYSWNDRYLASVTMRADGSSKFKSGNRWGYFPSAALAWRISEEEFMKDSQDWLSDLKIRASLGTAGNNNIPALSYMQVYSSKPANNYIPFTNSYWSAGTALNNENLKWETTVTRNIGVDYGFLHNRINGSVELYWNNTKDLLIDYQIPGSGYNTQMRNVGETSNKGIEVILNAAIIEKQDLRVNFNFNIGVNTNKVESLGGMDMLQASSKWTSDAEASDDYRVYVGQSVGLMYGYVTEGRYSEDDFRWDAKNNKWAPNSAVYTEVIGNDGKGTGTYKDANGNFLVDNSGLTGSSWGPGALKLRDLDGDGKITAADRQVIGNASPKHTGGFGLTAQYKGFDFAANFNWVYGNNIYNANKIEFTTTNKYTYRNMLTDMELGGRYTNIDPTSGLRVTDPDALAALNSGTDLWSPVMSRYAFHSWAVEDGSFLRLNNITLGYTFPARWMSKIFVQQLRLYVSLYNVWTWTNYSGYDPEVDTRRSTPLTPGVDYSAYPKSRSYNFGVNLTF